jgi:CHASE2 domain-containing sensor protein/tRNA A-37 threonylcarbamoyl transferase component Bud32
MTDNSKAPTGGADPLWEAIRAAEQWSAPPQDATRAGSGDEETALPTVSPASAPPLPAALPADFFPGYEILEEVNRGGQGVVYKALQQGTRRCVAIKVMREGPLASAADQARFEREIQVLGALRHRHIVTIHASGVVAGCSYYVMDYIAGVSLQEWFEQTRRPAGELLALFSKICGAIGAAHARGIIHRDLKPGNIRIDGEGEPNVLDFGLAKTGLGAGIVSPGAVTGTGQFLGSPAYSSPEQMDGRPDRIDARTDVYALGLILYQMLVGQLPYDVSGSFDSVRLHVRETQPRPPRSIVRDLDVDVETIVLRCLSKERERRYLDARALLADIERYLAGEPIEARRDSVAYVLRKRLRRGMQRNRLLAGMIVLVLSSAAGVGTLHLPYGLRLLDREFDRGGAAWLLSLRPAWSDDVVVVGLSDESMALVATLAEERGLSGVTPENRISLRKLHGTLFADLARAGVRVVCFDGFFEREDPQFDVAFAEGAHRLHDAGARLLVGVRTATGVEKPRIAATIHEVIDGWGWIYLARDEFAKIYGVWGCLHEAPVVTTPSLAIAVFAAREAGRDRSWRPYYYWEVQHSVLALAFQRTAPDGATVWRGYDRWLFLSKIAADRREGAPEGFNVKGRDAATLRVSIPDDETLKRHTIAYHDVLRMSDVDRRAHFEGKTVMIGDTRRAASGPGDTLDLHLMPDASGGREQSAVYLHAAAVCALMNGAVAIRPGWMANRLLTVFCATIGAVLGACWAADRAWRFAVLLGIVWLIVGLIGATVLLWYSALVSPSALLLAASLAAVVVWWMRRIRTKEMASVIR